MLRIPTDRDVIPPLTLAAVADTGAVESTVGTVEKRRKRSHDREKDEEPDWEKQQSRGSRKTTADTIKRYAMFGGALVATGVFVIFGMVLFKDRSGSNYEAAAAKVVAEAPEPEESDLEPVVLPSIMEQSQASFLEEIEPIARQFLAAKTVEEMLPHVRNPETTEPKMRRNYPDGRIDAPGMATLNPLGDVSYRGKFASVIVRTRDQETRQLAFVKTPAGFKIDWDSYVGWSDMSWEDFLASKPSDPKVFRVLLKRVEYYNFSFNDDLKWQSYSISSPDNEHVIYGYARRLSPLNSLVMPNGKWERVAMMLGLRFDPANQAGNQVVIDSYLTDGWIEGIDDESP